MSTLHEWVINQKEKACSWCGVAVFLVLLNFGLDAAAHMGG